MKKQKQRKYKIIKRLLENEGKTDKRQRDKIRKNVMMKKEQRSKVIKLYNDKRERRNVK